LSYLADSQTDRQTNKVWQKHYLLGEGKNHRKKITACQTQQNKMLRFYLFQRLSCRTYKSWQKSSTSNKI